MDDQTFDRLTRLFSTPGSRRASWRVLLGLALSGSATMGLGRSVRGAPKSPRAVTCKDGTTCHDDTCCGDQCCPGKCFVKCGSGAEFCCTGKDQIICGDWCCPKDGNANPCARSRCHGGGSGELCSSLIAGSYRRRR